MQEKFQIYKIKGYNHWEVYLHENQCYLGRVYIWAKREDAVDLMQMTSEERDELFNIGNEINKSIAQLFKPNLMNYAALGNIATHLHLHVIPRYVSSRQFDEIEFVDERWGKNYVPYNYDFKTPESTLLKLLNAIREKL